MMKKKYLAIDIGSQRMKIVHGGLEKDKIVIGEYDILDTPQNTLEDGKIINIDALTLVIKQAIKKNNLRAKKLILNISGTGIITRDIQIPKSNDDEIEKILEFEASQYFPVELDNYVLDYKVQEEFSNGEGVFNRVLLVAVPVSQIDEYMKVHKKLGMEICAIDIQANSVYKLLFGINYDKNIFERNKLPEDFAVLNIGAETTGVYICSKGKLKFNRIILNGSSAIDQSISQNLGMDLKEAEQLKISSGRITEDEQTQEPADTVEYANNLIKSVVNNIMNDINRFFEFYNSRSIGNKLEKIYVCGGGSKLVGFEGYLGNYLGVPVEHIFASLNNVVYNGKKGKEEFCADFPLLINAIGSIVRS